MTDSRHRQPRVLIVTPVFTNPPIQGNSARILAFGRELKLRGITVDVLHYCLDRYGPEFDAAMRREWNELIHVPARPHRQPSHPECWGIDDWCPDAVLDAVAAATEAVDYDAVVVNYVWMSRCFEVVDGPKKILDAHDLFGDRHVLSREIGLDPNWYFTRAAEEDLGFARADLVIGIQDLETAEIRARTATAVMTAGHPIEPHFLKAEDSSFKVATFGYFASQNPWNLRSAAALDRALKARPGAEVPWAVAGSICDAGVDYASQPFVFGRVNLPSDFYPYVDCCVNPMVGGTGLKIKTLEAMAHGRAIIGTRSGFSGLDAVHPFHDLEDCPATADAMADYHRSPALRDEVGLASRRLYLDYMARVTNQFNRLADFIRS